MTLKKLDTALVERRDADEERFKKELKALVLIILLCVYCRHPPFVDALMAYFLNQDVILSMGFVLEEILKVIGPKQSLVANEYRLGVVKVTKKNQSLTYDLSTFTLSNTFLKLMKCITVYSGIAYSNGQIVLEASWLDRVLGPLMSAHSLGGEGQYFAALRQSCDVQGWRELRISQSKTAKANLYCDVFPGLPEHDDIRALLKAHRRKNLSKDQIHDCDLIEGAVNAEVVYATSCKVMQQVAALFSDTEWTKLVDHGRASAKVENYKAPTTLQFSNVPNLLSELHANGQACAKPPKRKAEGGNSQPDAKKAHTQATR